MGRGLGFVCVGAWRLWIVMVVVVARGVCSDEEGLGLGIRRG